MSQSSDNEKSLNDQLEEGLSSFIDKTKEATSNLVDQAKDATSGLVDNVKSIVPDVSMEKNEDETPGINAPAPTAKGLEEGEDVIWSDGEETPRSNTPEETSAKEEEVILELGDIIYILDPTNEILNDNTFIIEFINPTKIRLVNIKSFEKTQLNIDAQGIIGEGTIQEIKILSRNPDKGFAKQNGLVTGKWVNIYFGGDFPAVITGEITNLEEDMIELKTNDGDTIYINFDYQGIPENLPIETFEIRPAPAVKTEGETGIKQGEYGEEGEPSEFEEFKEERGEKGQKAIPKAAVHEMVKQFIIEGDQFFLGDTVKVQEYVNIDKEKYRFNIESQTNDLLEEMVSTIPNIKRTPNVLNNIHIMITRFIELRNQSSTFDVNHNITGITKKTADDRPLAKYLSGFQNTLYWLLLVAKNVKKVYNKDEKSMDEDVNDIQYIDVNKDINELATLFKNYRANVVSEGQNKYAELYNSLNPFLTPFLNNDNESADELNESSIISGSINSNINAIIDNLGDLYSTIVANDSESTRKFVIQRYCLGLDRLEATNLKGSKMVAHRVKLTPNDTIKIKSVLTLPEPTVRFSQINLPGSNLLVKANLNLNFINYWQLLKQKTAVENVDITSLDDEIEYSGNNFVDNIKNYILDFSENERPAGLSDLDVYTDFLKIIIPKTRVLFNLVKKYIKGKLSMVDLINYLEPFLIYSSDLTYMQYIEFNKFIQSKIREYNSSFVEYSRAFAAIKNMNLKVSYKNPLFTLLNDNPEIDEAVFDAYGLNDKTKLLTMSGSEFLKQVKLDDFGNVYNIGVAFSNLQLMYPTSLKTIFEADKDTIKAQLDKNKADDTCTSYIVAKKYYSTERLQIDNGQIIYFDKDFDTTNYDIIDVEFKKERDSLTAEELTLYLTEQLQKKYKKDADTAAYMADTLVNRAKRVRDGHYAILAKSEAGTLEPTGLEYYIRKDNQWTLVPDVNPEWFIQSDDILCNIQTDCLFKTNKSDGECESIEVARETMVSNALKEILDQFDKNYQISKEDFNAKIQAKVKYYKEIYGRLQDIKSRAFLKYNNEKYELGLKALEDVKNQVISPHTKLRDLILSQNDFVKKQNDILLFARKFTRKGNNNIPNINDGEMENEWWLYCKETNTRLLPLFKYKLAKVFVTDPNNYQTILNELIKQIGKIGSNGDAWTDVNSGEVICFIESDVDEGYKDGFKVKSREVMEEDASSQSAVSANTGNTAKSAIANKVKLSPEGQLVSNVINGLASNMGINIDNSSSFIIKVVTELMNDTKVIYKESAYKEKEKKAAKEGKKIPEYGTVYSQTLMFLTLGMFLIGVQTNVPSLKTRKTFPGCVRSFSGFPIEGEGDDSGLNYLSCVAFKMKSKVMPWDALSRVKEEKLADTIKLFTVRYLLPYPEVEQKIREKVEYLLTNPEKDIPDDYNLDNWTTFLPPLRRFHIKGLQSVTDSFNEDFERDIKIGSHKQFEKLLVIESKIIAFSLAMQEEIQQIIEKKDLLLRSANNPFMDNACCNEKENVNKTTLEYFVNDNPNIGVYNTVVKELSAVLQDIKILTQSSIMLSTVDTKRIFPEIPENYSEETIYRAFIDLCKFQSTVPIDEDLATICIDKPDYLSKNDTLQEKIAKLKRDGRNYNKASFLRLFQIVSRNNIIRISLFDNETSYSDNLRKHLVKMDNEDDNIVSRGFRQKLETLLDTYDISIQEDTEDMRLMKNHLAHSNDMMRKDIIDFIKRKAKVGTGELRRITSFLKDLTVWDSDLKPRNKNMKISDDSMYNYINFYKTFISMLSNVIPTMILNKQTQTLESPSYWGLSETHANDLKNIVEGYYEPLKKFYGNNSITNILYEIQSKCRNLVLLANITPALTSIQIGGYNSQKDKTGDKASNKAGDKAGDNVEEDESILETYSVFDKRMATLLFEYYTLQIFIEYINLTKDPKMLSRMLITPEDESDTIYSADFLIEQQLRFSETEQQYIEGDVVKLQETVGRLLVAYITMMMNSKDTIDMSYDSVMDRVFKLKESEKYTFTDRLQNLTEEERAVDTILKANKLGVWSKGLTKGIKEYDPENYDQEKQMTEQIAEIEKTVRRRNTNVTDRNVDMFLEDALDEMATDEFVNNDEVRMGDINEDNDDGDPFGDERDPDNDDDYN